MGEMPIALLVFFFNLKDTIENCDVCERKAFQV